jgi:hypothetical protein
MHQSVHFWGFICLLPHLKIDHFEYKEPSNWLLQLYLIFIVETVSLAAF